jgi:uncharacterized glyoxalase superfamily protein PhnB
LCLDQVELWIDARNLASQRWQRARASRGAPAFRHKYPHEALAHETLVFGLRIEEWRRRGGQAAATDPGLQLAARARRAGCAATAEYYRDKLGFEIAFLFGDPPTYARYPERMVGNGREHSPLASGCPPPIGGLALYLSVGPASTHCTTLQSEGHRLVGEIVQQPWGMREFAIRDCNGYVLRFGTPG